MESMKLTTALNLVKDTIVAYGGYCAGGFLASKYGKNEESLWKGQFWGMSSALIFAQFVTEKLEEKAVDDSKMVNPAPEVNYRTDHATRIKSEPKPPITRNL